MYYLEEIFQQKEKAFTKKLNGILKRYSLCPLILQYIVNIYLCIEGSIDLKRQFS